MNELSNYTYQKNILNNTTNYITKNNKNKFLKKLKKL